MRNRLTFGLAIAGMLAAQEARVDVDNEQVKVVTVTVQPHQKTRMHDHQVNRVMIYLNAGSQRLDYQDGTRKPLAWKAGEAKWSPASGLHVAEVLSGQAVKIVEVELKKPGNPEAAPTGLMDPVKLDPKHYKVEFENDQVRVLRAKFPAGEGAPMHEHSRYRVVTYLTGQKMKVTGADGKVEISEHQAGDVVWGGLSKHKEENQGGPVEILIVELKG